MIVIGYAPGAVLEGMLIVRLVLGPTGVTDDEPRLQEIPLAPPHAPCAASCTGATRPFNQFTVTAPCEAPPEPAMKFCGDELAEMPKSGTSGVLQPLKLKDPIAVFQLVLEVAV